MESGRSGLLDKLKAGIWKILKKEQGEPKKKQGKTENQESLKQESWTDELRDLAPIDNVENFDTYEQTLNWAFQNERVKNIALSGPYGSGKSSIIESYLKNHTDVKSAALKISLASFTSIDTQVDSSQDDVETKIQIDEEEIERGILKQLFYAANPESIPQTCYRRLRPKGIFNYLRIFLIIMTLIVFGLASVNADIKHNILDVIGSFFHQEIKKESGAEFAELLLISAVISGAVLLLFKNQLVKFRLSSLNLFSNLTITDKTNEEESVFNQKLDEIMYFFETMKYDTVFFEDLDRLNNPIIFVHLRELNQLLNNDQLIGRKPIRFVYAVRDDIFLAEDRTKFFDFIIPVYPVTNHSNSFELLSALIEKEVRRLASKSAGNRELTEWKEMMVTFIAKIGIYITDRRTAFNIFNEFLICMKLRGGDYQSQSIRGDKLMAMIVFKNLYPYEFSEVQKNGGAIERYFLARARARAAENMDLDHSNKDTTNFISAKWEEEEKVKSYNELLQYLIINKYIDEDYENYITDIENRDFICIVKGGRDPNFNLKIKNPSQLIERLGEEYFSQESILNYDIFRELMGQRHDPQKVKNFLDVLYQGMGMVKKRGEFLEGLIGEEWFNIDSKQCKHFFENSLLKWQGMADYILRPFEDVDYNLDFYISENGEVVPWYNEMHPYGYDVQIKYIRMMLYTLFNSDEVGVKKFEVEILRNQNKSGSLKRFFEEHIDILERLFKEIDSEENPSNDTRISLKLKFLIDIILETLDVKFSALEFKEISLKIQRDLWGYIIKGNHYVLNHGMMRSIINHLDSSSLVDFEARPYSTVMALKSDEVSQYVQKEMGTFVENIVLTCNNPADNPEYIIDMLCCLKNSHESADTSKEDEVLNLARKLIEKENFQLNRIAECVDDEEESTWWKQIWDILLENDKIKVSLDNVHDYSDKYGYNDILKSYFERHEEELNSGFIEAEIDG
jgi:hypothetical protein